MSRRLDSRGLQIENLKFQISNFNQGSLELRVLVRKLLKLLDEDVKELTNNLIEEEEKNEQSHNEGHVVDTRPNQDIKAVETTTRVKKGRNRTTSKESSGGHQEQS